MKDRRTIIALKIRGSRWQRDLWSLAKILTLVCLVISAIGAVQVALCPHKKGWTVIGCLRVKNAD